MTEHTPSGSAFRQLLAYARPHGRKLAVGALVSALGGVSALATPLLAKEFVDRLGSGRSVLGLSIVMGAIVLSGALVGATGRYLIDRTAEGIVHDVRRSLLSRLLRLRVGVVDRMQPGDLLSRVTADTTLLRHATTNDLVDLTIGVIVMVGMVGFMAYLDLVLLGVVAAVLVTIGGATALVMPRIGAASKRVQEALGDAGGYLERALGALRTIKANGAERREIDIVHRAVGGAYRQGVAAARWSAVAGASAGLILQVSFLAVFGVGGARVADGSLPVSSLIAFLMYLFYLYSPINQVVQGVSGLQVGMAAVRRIEEVNALPAEPVDDAGRVELRPVSDVTVAFRSVHFRYLPDGPPVLAGADFEVPAGGMTALVGPSGAGKSTIFALLERFYHADSGVVEFAGHDVRRIPLGQLRAAIGYVEQDAPVLSGTLRDNLLFAAPYASVAQLDEVIRRTSLEETVRRLPAGLDTRVGHRGTTLSGGERQRIAIARALLRRPALLLLDEATSALDGLNERSLRDVIAEAAQVSTVLIIAHRLSTVTMARQILLLDGGRIRARGTHAQLIESDDLYRTLAATQLLRPDSGREAVPTA